MRFPSKQLDSQRVAIPAGFEVQKMAAGPVRVAQENIYHEENHAILIDNPLSVENKGPTANMSTSCEAESSWDPVLQRDKEAGAQGLALSILKSKPSCKRITNISEEAAWNPLDTRHDGQVIRHELEPKGHIPPRGDSHPLFGLRY